MVVEHAYLFVWCILIQKEANSQKISRRSRDERKYSDADNRSGIKKTEKPQSTAFKSFGTQRKSAKGFMGNLTDQQVLRNFIPVHNSILFLLLIM